MLNRRGFFCGALGALAALVGLGARKASAVVSAPTWSAGTRDCWVGVRTTVLEPGLHMIQPGDGATPIYFWTEGDRYHWKTFVPAAPPQA